MSVGSFPGVASATPGSQLWVKLYNGTGDYIDQASALGVSPDGSEVFVTGSSYGLTSGWDYATVAYDTSTGAKLWVTRYNGTANDTDGANALGVSPDGTMVFVTGSSPGSTSGWDYATVAYDTSTGAALWVTRYNGSGNRADSANALGVSPDGTMVFVTGFSSGSTSHYDYTTVAYDASTGAKLWVKRYNSTWNGFDSAGALGVSPDGSKVFVTGVSTGSAGDYDYATVAYNASTGAQLWVKRYNGPGSSDDTAHALKVGPGGHRVFVTGQSYGSTSYYDYATVAYDASTGAKLWAKRYNGPGNGYDIANALRVSPDGSEMFVTGSSDGGTSGWDYATVAYDASTGARLWVTRYNGTANDTDSASALGVSPDGTMVFVTGSSTGSTSRADYATVAYDASTGAELWVTRYNGSGNRADGASALGVSPDATTVFVTGYSAVGNSFDYATLAYGAA